MRSIRVQFSIVLFLITACATGCMSAAAYWWMQRSLYREFDASLESQADTLAGLVEKHDNDIELEIPPDAIPQFAVQSSVAFFVVLDQDGKKVASSANYDRFKPNLKFDEKRKIRSIELPGDRDARQISMLVQPRQEDGENSPNAAQPVGLIVVADCEGIEHTLSLLGASLIVLPIGFAVAAGFIAFALAGRVLRPLHQLSEWTANIDAHRLNERLPEKRWPTELSTIATQLNALLARLGDSFERERRFGGNLSHELRTPVAELSSLAEMANRWPEDETAMRQLRSGAKDIADRMKRLIDVMLQITRAQEASAEQLELVDLKRATQDAISRHADVFEKQKIALKLTLNPAALAMRHGFAEQLIENLISNAAYHAKEGTDCLVALGVGDGPKHIFAVANVTTELSQDDLSHLTEPLWRKEHSRSDSQRTGLGLFVAKLLAEAIGAKLVFDLSDQQVFTARVEFTPPAEATLRPIHDE